MNWPVYDAKARFSELLDSAITKGPQIVSRRGVEAAVLVNIHEWRRLCDSAHRPLIDPLLDPEGPTLDHLDFAEIRRQTALRPRHNNLSE